MIRMPTPGTSASASMSNHDRRMGIRTASARDYVAHAHAHASTTSPASTRTCPRIVAPCRARARGRKGRSVSWTARTWRGRGCARSPTGRPRRTCLIARIMFCRCFSTYEYRLEDLHIPTSSSNLIYAPPKLTWAPALESDALHVQVVLLLRHVRPGEEE